MILFLTVITVNEQTFLDLLSLPLSFCPVSLLPLHTLLSLAIGGVSNDQTTGNVWVTHEEMETLAATPPTVSLS